ncbi:MAG: cytochrome-c peroxidase [Gemmatimonadota bacterium]|nr:MAG: cytochrome-c peroxidase [Gemmatimonadota bacterium]
MKRLLPLVALLFPLACQQADTTPESAVPIAVAGLAALPTDPPELVGNPITERKVELGKMLFFEPRLSRSWLISCNTCHNLALGGVDLLATSVGHGWQKGPRNSPTVLNAVFNIAQFWDGRAADLKEQAMGPVQAAVEMNSTPDRVVQTLQSIPEYVQLFEEAFPDEANPVTFENMARAIEAFEATLITPGSPFDRYLAGDEAALDEAQLQGLELFTGKGCTACHGGHNVGGAGYFPFGLVQRPGADLLPPGDKGRSAVTQVESDDYFFKAPSLRNVDLTPPYFHSGAVWDLGAAVRVMGTAQLGTDLTEAEATSIVAFLRSLTGSQPQIDYPILPRHTKDTPLPELGPMEEQH